LPFKQDNMDLYIEKLKIIDQVIHTYNADVIDSINKVLEKAKVIETPPKVKMEDLRKRIQTKMTESESY